MGDAVSVLWFRRDLRVADHPALGAAAAHGAVMPVFVHDPALRGPSGANRLAFLDATLDALDAELGGRLVQRHGDPATVIAAIASEVEAEAVYVTEDFGPYGRRRDARVESLLARDGRRLERVDSPYAVMPGTLRTKGGTPFQVFTPFARAWRTHGWAEPLEVPSVVRYLDGIASDGRPAGPSADALDRIPEAGEEAAHRLVAASLDGGVEDYAEARDRPDLDATSRLSPHLKYGAVHPRQILARLSDAPGATSYANELAWRDFYADVLFHRPDTVTANVVATLDGLRWDTGPGAEERFEAWCTGATGYPIVDAGMRQLLAEGWMHNRVRMIVASFLVKDLHLDWRWGAAWFLRHLVDGDLASNTHGWQWTAGTGTDAAPFFRVFNPTLQGRRFDPAGDYVRRYVPELRSIAGGAVHEPWKVPTDLFAGAAVSYPDPIVDHAAERDEALARYQQR